MTSLSKQLKAFMELDDWLARNLMGWEDSAVRSPWSPTTDLVAAFQVKDQLKKLGFSFALWDVPDYSSIQPGVVAAFRKSIYPPNRNDKDLFIGGGECEEEAISFAARKAMEAYDKDTAV